MLLNLFRKDKNRRVDILNLRVCAKKLIYWEYCCLFQKWERENSKLPRHLRRKPPPKPDHPLSQDDWNKFAWDASQVSSNSIIITHSFIAKQITTTLNLTSARRVEWHNYVVTCYTYTFFILIASTENNNEKLERERRI